MRNEFTVVIEPPTEDDPWFIAYCPEIPEANGQGRTKEEVLENLRDGIARRSRCDAKRGSAAYRPSRSTTGREKLHHDAQNTTMTFLPRS